MDLSVWFLIVLITTVISITEISLTATNIIQDRHIIEMEAKSIIRSDRALNDPKLLAYQSNSTFLDKPGIIRTPCHTQSCGNGTTITRVRVHDGRIFWIRF